MTTSLAGWLATRSAEQLVATLRARPDLARPAPRDLAALSTRASVPSSLQRALEDLDVFALQVLHAVLVLPAPVTRADLQALLPDDDLDPPLARLATLLLAWESADGVRTTRALRQLITDPAGLGRPAAELLPPGTAWHSPADIERLLGQLPAAARELLDGLAKGPPRGTARGAHDPSRLASGSPLRAVVEQQLLLPIGTNTVELPREVGIALRGSLLGASRRQPPAVTTTAVGVPEADAAGAHEALEAVRLVGEVLHRFGAAPPAVLRSGGLGVRDLKALARGLNHPETAAALWVEVCLAAGLLDQDHSKGVWAPTPEADLWGRREPAARWAVLAAAWLDLARLPHLVGERDDRDKPLTALSAGLTSWSARDTRRLVLGALASLPPGQATTPADLTPLLSWLGPLRGGAAERLVEPILAEAARLGITGRGALTGFGRAVLTGAGGEQAAAALAPLLPSPVTTVLLQADLTAVAPGPLRPDLADQLAVLATVESSGAATVYRFSEAGIRRALDSGQSAEAVLAFLESVSSTPVPQPLSYLVGDVARRHGLLRAGGALSYLRADDTGLVAEVLAAKATAALKLRQLAPTVLVSAAPVSRVLEVLRAAGYAPVGENAGGGALLARQPSHRTPRRERWTGPEGRPASEEQLSQLVDRLRAAPPGTEPAGDLEEILSVVRGAQASRSKVRLHWLAAAGRTQSAVVQPLAVHSGQLVAADAGTGMPRMVPLSRVSSAVLVP